MGNFSYIDWITILGYLVFTTFIGHIFRGKQNTIKDFFLGGRTLPWYAVAGSIIATEISGVTIIGIPAMIYAQQGDFTFLQWIITLMILSKILVAIYFIPYFYKYDIYSPYDLMEKKLGKKAKQLTTIMFGVGSILGQSVRILIAAIVLRIITGFSFEWCILIIGLFSIAWTLMGGMSTVIWTDVVQFLLFVFVGILSLIWMINDTEGGLSSIIDIASGNNDAGINKFTWLNLSTDPAFKFTMWVALFAVPINGINAYGVDQLMVQRLFCCKNAREAKKALIGSILGLPVTLIFMFIGVVLFVYYMPLRMAGNEPALFAADSNSIFPYWIVNHLPVVFKGLVIGGIFAAAISSLDSLLAALSQTSLSLFYNTNNIANQQKKILRISKVLVVSWGILLSLFTILLYHIQENVNIVELAFGMVTYTAGPMLAIFIASILNNRLYTLLSKKINLQFTITGLTIGVITSFIMVMIIRTDFFLILLATNTIEIEDVKHLSMGLHLWENGKLIPQIADAWMWTITFLWTFLCGYFLKTKKK